MDIEKTMKQTFFFLNLKDPKETVKAQCCSLLVVTLLPSLTHLLVKYE